MSFDLSWAGFNQVSKSSLLDALGFHDTAAWDEVNEAPFSCAELPTGWTVLYAPDSTYTFKNITHLSANHAVLSVIVQEFVPLSLASFHVRGEQSWSVMHDGEQGPFAWALEGQVPPQTGTIHDRLAELGRSSPDFDHLYDGPIELAASICGYRHDRFRFDWGLPYFTVVEPIR